jgi:hypothetical protein
MNILQGAAMLPERVALLALLLDLFEPDDACLQDGHMLGEHAQRPQEGAEFGRKR